MTENEKREAINCIKTQLENDYVDISGVHYENELEIIRKAINSYGKLPCVKLIDDYDEELRINGKSVYCHKRLYPADVLEALAKHGIINFVYEK